MTTWLCFNRCVILFHWKT